MVNWKWFVKRIPSSVQVNRKTHYEIMWTKEFMNEKGTMGIKDGDKKLIAIKMGMSDKLTIETYIHELLHAFSDESGAGLTEAQIRALEPTFYYWFKKNNIFKESK